MTKNGMPYLEGTGVGEGCIGWIIYIEGALDMEIPRDDLRM